MEIVAANHVQKSYEDNYWCEFGEIYPKIIHENPAVRSRFASLDIEQIKEDPDNNSAKCKVVTKLLEGVTLRICHLQS